MPKTKGTAGREPRTRSLPPNISTTGGQAQSDITPRQAPVRSVGRGRVVRAFGADPRERYAVRYELREINDLITSNTDTGSVNPAYPAELQPRDRTRAASRQQITSMAKDIVPAAYTGEFNSLDRGAPIIGDDNVVESGNGRTMALRQAVRDNPEGYRAYTEQLKTDARARGIRPEDVDKYKNPILVRVRVDNVDRVKFAQAANTATALGMSDTEKSRSDAGRIKSTDLITFRSAGDNIDDDLTRADNREFIRGFASRLPESERAASLDRRGELTQSGAKRIKAAMFTRVYDDPDMADRIFESMDNDTKTLTNSLMVSLPSIARSEELVKSGKRDASLSIAGDVKIAVNTYVSIKERKDTVSNYLNQTAMFGDELNTDQKRILRAIDERRRSGKALGEFLSGWGELVEAQPDKNQTSMFGEQSATREELINKWLAPKPVGNLI